MKTSTTFLAASVLACLLLPATAESYCASPLDMALFWGSSFPNLEIPVWVVVSPSPNSASWTGQSEQDIARVVIEVIARHNETVGAPKLYFAGFSTQGFEPSQAQKIDLMPTGISVMSASCEEQMNPCQNVDAVACASYGARTGTNDAIGWVLLLPVGCDASPEWSLVGYADMAQVMLHEIGHTLGLKHADLSQTECEAAGGVHGGDPAGANGVMFSIVPANFAANRSWRRDDLEGLHHWYGPVTPDYEIAWWSDDDYPDYPSDAAGTSIQGMSVSRSVAVSNHPSSNGQLLATTAPDGRVLHRVMDANGDLSPSIADSIVDPSPMGLSWAMPGTAVGTVDDDERVFVAWMANEAPQSSQVTLRMATRSLASSAWSFADHPDVFRVNRIALGFDDHEDVALVATMHPSTSELMMAVFDGQGDPLGSTMILPEFVVFDVGTPVCQSSRCLVPYSEAQFGGPNMAIADIAIDMEGQTLMLLSSEVYPTLDTRGRLTMVEDGMGLWATSGERRFSLGGYPSISPDMAAFQLNPSFDWPIGVGRWDDGAIARLFQPRAVVCGNGIVQANEACDDGNGMAGDGCEQCIIAPVDGDDGGDGGADEVGDSTESGGGVDEVGGGCECRAQGSMTSGEWLAILALLSLPAVRRRRS